jgi:hypothetical protein
LITGYLISTVEKLPRPNESELAESLHRKVFLPAATCILIIPSMGIFVGLWAMQWHWFHASGSTPACSYLWTLVILGWLGTFVIPAVMVLLIKERAVFATIVGLMVYFPIRLTDALSGDNILRATSLLTKSCQWDTDDFSTDGFGIGVVTAVLSQALLAISVAKVISTWRSCKNALSCITS